MCRKEEKKMILAKKRKTEKEKMTLGTGNDIGNDGHNNDNNE